MTLWICVSNDKYELPIAVADTAAELARMLGVKHNTILSATCNADAGRTKWCKYKKVVIDDDETDHI